jgi:hypothetical protein
MSYNHYKKLYLLEKYKNNFSGGSYNILDKLNDTIQSNYIHNYQFEIINPEFDRDDIFYGPFIAPVIKDYIKHQTFSSILVDNTKFYTTTPLNDNIFKELVRRTLTLNKILNITKQVQVFYIDSPFEKILPDYGPIKTINVNSGVSTNYYSVVYRKEEAPKVLVHELLHQYEVDCNSACNVYEHNFNLKDNQKHKKKLLINESLVESLATIINCMFMNKDYKKLIEDEKQFILYQSAKILNYYGYKNYDDQHIIVSDTSLFEYYLFKAVILNNLDEFIDFLNKNNPVNILKFDRTKNKQLYNKIISFINQNFKNKINNLLKLNNFDKTMRMTKNIM